MKIRRELPEEPAINEFLKIVGGYYSPIRDDYYENIFQKHPILKGIASIGPNFYMIGDAKRLQYLHVSDTCQQIIGYTSQEIMEEEWKFQFQKVHHEDLQQCLEMSQTAWSFLKELPPQEQLKYVCNFYYRAVRKDLTTIKVQHQVGNLEIDADGRILLVFIIITDISHLDFSTEVKLAIVNTEENTCLLSNHRKTSLLEKEIILSRRESEILNLFQQG
ncbi:PAS domain-containing protein [Larkinella soli]|uniref:PAS domain-containing protein n=1 Tax=Larkinella soli TaxID=1770527 RepID=UPI000FFBA3AC|nr:PAS domain-containing protein [Larkinella soli]